MNNTFDCSQSTLRFESHESSSAFPFVAEEPLIWIRFHLYYFARNRYIKVAPVSSTHQPNRDKIWIKNCNVNCFTILFSSWKKKSCSAVVFYANRKTKVPSRSCLSSLPHRRVDTASSAVGIEIHESKLIGGSQKFKIHFINLLIQKHFQLLRTLAVAVYRAAMNALDYRVSFPAYRWDRKSMSPELIFIERARDFRIFGLLI